MGCVASQHDINDLHANIFQVVNVDDLGHRFSAAKLEVTDTHLVLHQRGKSAIRWPLRCLRRYGFDGELFSFESGRRCPTGPGIYAFKCRRAEALFNLLQLHIQNIAEETASRDPATHQPQLPEGSTRTGGGGALLPPSSTTDGYVEPRWPRGVVDQSGTGTIRSPTSPPSPLSPTEGAVYINNGVVVNVGGPGSRRGGDDGRGDVWPPSTPGHDLYLHEAPDTPSETGRTVILNPSERTVNFMNPSERSHLPHGVPQEVVRQLPSAHDRVHRSHTEHSSSYVNVDPNNKAHYDLNNYTRFEDLHRFRHLYINVEPEGRKDTNSHMYANIGADKDVPAVPPRPSLYHGPFLNHGSAGSGSSHSGTTTTTTTDIEQRNSQVNYIMLDLYPGSDSSHAIPSSPMDDSMVSGPESPPNRPTEGYTIIDFNKTDALRDTVQTAASRDMEGDMTRKTRHNSTFSDLTLTRHNSSLSD